MRDAFNALSCTARRERVPGVTSAEKPETRIHRIAQTVEPLTGRA